LFKLKPFPNTSMTIGEGFRKQLQAQLLQ
jgi:hypothetical protein